METRQQGGFVNEENKDKDKKIEVEEFQEFARKRPPDPPEEGSNWLRGCGIALGIAALVFLFVVGACFMKFG